jgi:hypothetical protein
MEVIEALRTSILEPHEHLHINHARALGRSVHATQVTRFGRNASGQVGGQAVDHIGSCALAVLGASYRVSPGQWPDFAGDRRLSAPGRDVNHCRERTGIILLCVRGAERPRNGDRDGGDGSRTRPK